MSHTYPEHHPSNYEKQNTQHHDQPEKCDHMPDGWKFDQKHDAFLISECETCGAPLIATEIDTELLEETGELSVEEYREDPQ